MFAGDKPQGLKEIEEVAGLAESRSPPVLWGAISIEES